MNPAEIKQIEVIRGPASAIWGANAMNGVVNVITKSPRELQGTSLTMGVGALRPRSRQDASERAASLFYVNGSHAQAVNDRWAYKISAGFYTQDPLGRPTGADPERHRHAVSRRTPTRARRSRSSTSASTTTSPTDGDKLVFAGGFAGTDGIIHSGIGPFDIDSGTVLGYGKVNYSKGAMKVNFFTTSSTATPPTCCAVGIDRAAAAVRVQEHRPTTSRSATCGTFGSKHVFSYGGNFRYNNFDLSLAPLGESRNEGGAYVQDEMFLGKYFRWLRRRARGQVHVIDDAEFSPRTTLMFKPSAAQTVRVSFNRAYRAPSLINNYLDTTIINQLPLGAINPALAGRFTTSRSAPSAATSACRRSMPPQDLTRVAHRLRDRLHGRHHASARRCRRPSTSTTRRTTSSSRRWLVSRGQPAAGLAAAAVPVLGLI